MGMMTVIIIIIIIREEGEEGVVGSCLVSCIISISSIILQPTPQQDEQEEV